MVPTYPSSLVADATTPAEVRDVIAAAPPASFILPRNISEHPSTPSVLRDLMLAGHLTRPRRGVYYKPARPSDDGVGPDAEAVYNGIDVRFIRTDGSAADDYAELWRSPSRRVITRELLEQLYVNEKLSTQEIGTRHSISADTVLRALRAHGIEVRKLGPAKQRTPGLVDSEVAEAYKNGETLAEIATRLACDTRTIRRSLARSDTEVSNLWYAELNADNLRKRYVENGESAMKIAADIGCSATAVAGALKRSGIEIRPWTERNGLDQKLTPEFLQEELVVKGRSFTSIAREVGCDRHTVSAWAARAGITTA